MKKKKSKTHGKQKQPETARDESDDLRSRIDNLQKEKDELFAQLQRVSADYDNLQKRTARQIADTIGYEKEKIIKTILPALDDFERTIQNTQSAANVNVLLEGIQIVYDKMLDILKSHNVEQIKAVGEPFDPALHDAIMPRSEDTQENNIVLEEHLKGYKLNGRVIRHCKVIVNKLSQEQPSRKKEEPTEQTTNECQVTDTE
jgi:molecular chaperone GrpE